MAEPNPIPEDPLYKQSMSWSIAVWTILMVITFAWACWDEGFTRRPYLGLQSEFRDAYRKHLQELKPRRENALAEVQAGAEYRALEKTATETKQKADAEKAAIGRDLAAVNPEVAALTEVFPVARSYVQAVVYRLEMAATDEDRAQIRAEIEEYKKGPFTVKYRSGDADMEKSYTYAELQGAFDAAKDKKAALQRSLAVVDQPRQKAAQALDEYVKRTLVGPAPNAVEGLITKMSQFDRGIRQIHVAEIDLVDRCESCHLGIREPVTITAADLAGTTNARAFTSHPNKELLATHDPEKFGCSPCHNGNGVSVTSTQYAHGRNKHWLWPMYQRENMEAGCVQCHQQDLVLEHAPTLNHGKETFRHLGCNGCHPREGFDIESAGLQSLAVDRRALSLQTDEHRKKVLDSVARSDASEDPEELMRLKHLREVTYTLEASALETRLRELDVKEKSLMTDRKKIGPNLKEVKAKLRREWIPEWIRAPHEFRPDTKMPSFRLTPEQTRQIAAFIWQRSLDVTAPKQEPGSSERGKALFETRGCLGCHTMGEGDGMIGDGFSANLTRVGEKAHYDYLVRWIHDPTRRLLPYCPSEKRDIGPKDYEARGLPFVFDVDHSRCPSCGREMQWRQMTVMPDFRLTLEEARDIATYLKSLRKIQDADYPSDVAYLDDPALAEKGIHLVRHFGCAGCHEISGMEDENRIGTDLTEEGSKPIERLDFGLFTHQAKDEGWYDHKGFFEHKLEQPEKFDEGKVKEDELEKLRMPKPRLTQDDITALTTYLLGSVKSAIPSSHHYAPTDQRQAISEGWWVIRKYNCVGCHSVVPDQEPALWKLPAYAGEEAWKRPPSLVGEGARVNPEWLARFLANPALGEARPHQNGVRTYLDVRMPSFHLSPNEIGKLVRFFRAMAGQPPSHVPGDHQPLAGAELQMARDAFDSNQCLKCHPTEAAAAGAELGGAIAPNLLLAKQRLNPRWVERFIVDPARLMPGTKMPAGLFKHEGGRWVIAGQIPKSMEEYKGDHRSLFIRYLDQITESELKRK